MLKYKDLKDLKTNIMIRHLRKIKKHFKDKARQHIDHEEFDMPIYESN